MRAPLTERNVRTGKFQRVSPSYLGTLGTRRQAATGQSSARDRRKNGYRGPLTRAELSA